MKQFFCKYFNSLVELSEEREKHIIQNHPEIKNDLEDLIREILLNPDLIRLSNHIDNARLFSKFFSNYKNGKHVVTVVVSNIEEANNARHWIITTYLTGKTLSGEIEWKRS